MIINSHKLCQKGTSHWCFVYHFCPDDRVAADHENFSLEIKIPPHDFEPVKFLDAVLSPPLAHFVHWCPDQQVRPAEGLPSILSFVHTMWPITVSQISALWTLNCLFSSTSAILIFAYARSAWIKRSYRQHTEHDIVRRRTVWPPVFESMNLLIDC